MRRESIRLGLGIPKMSSFSSYVLSVPRYGAPKFPHLPSKSASQFLQGFVFHLVPLPLASPTWCPAGATTLSCPDEPPSSEPQPPHLPCCPFKNNCPSYKMSLNIKVTIHMWDFQGESPPLIMKIHACTIAPPTPPNKQKPPLPSTFPCLLAGRRAPACQHFWWAARRAPLRISLQ